jgi:hypothetical protein
VQHALRNAQRPHHEAGIQLDRVDDGLLHLDMDRRSF